MPWCPVCKNEYKDGYTLCADCGAELVAFLETEEKAEINNESENSNDNESYETLPDEAVIAEMLSEMDPETLAELTKRKSVHESVKPYVKAKDRAADYKSSAYALLMVGIAGAAFLILTYLNIIPINLAANINALFYIVMGIMFVAFIIVGIKSLSAAKVIAGTADDEDELTAKIYTFFNENHTVESIDKLALDETIICSAEEEKFFPRSLCIKKIIIENFGELDDAYVTELTETVYSDIFEK